MKFSDKYVKKWCPKPQSECVVSSGGVEMELARHRALTHHSLAIPTLETSFVEMELARHRALTHVPKSGIFATVLVEMELARHRALTHDHPSAFSEHLNSCRNGVSPPQGIDTPKLLSR